MHNFDFCSYTNQFFKEFYELQNISILSKYFSPQITALFPFSNNHFDYQDIANIYSDYLKKNYHFDINNFHCQILSIDTPYCIIQGEFNTSIHSHSLNNNFISFISRNL